MKLKYAVVFERTPNNYSAYAPDLPGCISAAKTWDDIQVSIREAIEFHIAGINEDGDLIPEPMLSVAEAAAYHNDTVASSTEWDGETELVAVVAVEVNAGAEPMAAEHLMQT